MCSSQTPLTYNLSLFLIIRKNILFIHPHVLLNTFTGFNNKKSGRVLEVKQIPHVKLNLVSFSVLNVNEETVSTKHAPLFEAWKFSKEIVVFLPYCVKCIQH